MDNHEELNFYPTSFDNNNENDSKYESTNFSQDVVDDGEVLIDELPLLDGK